MTPESSSNCIHRATNQVLKKLLESIGVIELATSEQETWISQELRKGATLINYELEFGFCRYRERYLFQPHVKVPSLFLAGKYNLRFFTGSRLAVERYEQFQEWLKTLEEDKDYDCFPPSNGKVITRAKNE
jgi:hypothetical protein